MQKFASSGKKTGWLIVRNGKIGIRWDPNQQFGTKCHQASDVLLPGQAVNRQRWNDTPKLPEDPEQQHEMQQI